MALVSLRRLIILKVEYPQLDVKAPNHPSCDSQH